MKNQFLIFLTIMMAIISCKQSTIKERTLHPKATVSSDNIILEIAWDSSFYKHVYKLTSNQISLSLTRNNFDSSLFNKNIDNTQLFKKLAKVDLQDFYLENKLYWNSQVLDVTINGKTKKVHLTSFDDKPINEIKKVINSNLPQNLKPIYYIK